MYNTATNGLITCV